MNSYRFDYKFVREFVSDQEALEEANTWHDDRPAIVEKWIDECWCPHSDPIYQPQLYFGGNDGGWMHPDGTVYSSLDEWQKKEMVVSLRVDGRKYTMVIRRNGLGELYRFSTPNTPPTINKLFDQIWVSDVSSVL
jgi:hypothetical protein